MAAPIHYTRAEILDLYKPSYEFPAGCARIYGVVLQKSSVPILLKDAQTLNYKPTNANTKIVGDIEKPKPTTNCRPAKSFCPVELVLFRPKGKCPWPVF